jgi:hypothetical protein
MNKNISRADIKACKKFRDREYLKILKEENISVLVLKPEVFEHLKRGLK